VTIRQGAGQRDETGRAKVEERQRHVTLCGRNQYSLIDRDQLDIFRRGRFRGAAERE
jgi:hypothetical protein